MHYELYQVDCSISRDDFSVGDHAKLSGDESLKCACTVRNREIVYDMGGLNAPEWTQAPPDYRHRPNYELTKVMTACWPGVIIFSLERNTSYDSL